MVQGRWMKLWSKEILARAIDAVGFPRLNAARQRLGLGGRRLLIVSYHRVVEDCPREARCAIPGLLISAATLRRQLTELGRRYEIVPLARAIEELRWSQLGSDLAVVTFDDGYADVHEHALPVLQSFAVPATIFLATGFVGTERRLPHDRLFATLRALGPEGIDPDLLPSDLRLGHLEQLLRPPLAAEAAVDGLLAGLSDRSLAGLIEALERRTGLSAGELPEGTRLLSWAMVRRLVAAGHSLGAHTVDHRVLPNLPIQGVREELLASKRAILTESGVTALDFAYPNGWYSRLVLAEVVAAGFRSSVTTEARFNGPGSDPFRLGRFTLWEGSSLGPGGYSEAIAARQLDGSFCALGIPKVVSGLLGEARVAPAEARPRPQLAARASPLPLGRGVVSFPRPEGEKAWMR